MSLADQQWCPTSVQVTVLQARGLRAKGKSGTNDAYAVMQVGKEKYQTSVVEKTVAPSWKEEAAFDLPPLLQGGGGGGTERGTLRVHVLHRALVGPDKLLGQAVINLLQLSEDKSRNKTEWFKLLDKTGKRDKDRGEVFLDIQFLRNNMTASMFDLSAAGKSRSRLGKFKDKVRGKKKESDSTSGVVPSLTQVLTDSEEETNGDGEVPASKDGKKKKHKMKSLFSPKSNLQKNMSQSMSVLPVKNSSLSGSQSSGLNVDSSEGKKKFKFMIHKRSDSSDSKDLSSGHQKHVPVEQSNLCINGSHIYCEEPPPRTSRIGSNFSQGSSGLGSMEDVPENSPASVDSLRAVRKYSPWTEEDEEEETTEVENKEDVDEAGRGEEERTRMEKERTRIEEERRRKEEEEMVRRQQEERERLAEQKRRQEEEERREEEERLRREQEEWLRREEERERLAEEERQREEEKERQEEEERVRMEEERAQEERERRQEEERKLAEEKKLKEEEKKRIEEEKARKEEEERAEEERRQKEKELLRRQEEREEKRRQEEQERRQREEEEVRRQEREERARKEKAEYERLMEEKKRIEKIRMEEEERIRMEEEKKRMEEERMRRQELEEKRRQEEQKRKKAEERIRMEEEKRRIEEERMRRQELEEKRLEEQERKKAEQEKRQKEEEERIRIQEEERREEEERARKEKEEYERLMEEKRIEKIKKEEEERIRMEEEKKRIEEERMRRQEELEEKRRLEEQERKKAEQEKRQKEKEERIRIQEEERLEEEEKARKEKEEYERLMEEKMRQEEQKRIEEERIRMEQQERMEEERRREEERARKEKEEMERLAEERRKLEEQEKRRFEEEEKRAERERKEQEGRRLEKEKLRAAEQREKRKDKTKDGQRAAGKKSKVSSPAEVTSTNPFDENFSSNPFEEIHDTPSGPYSSTAKVATAQQRCQSAVSSVGSKPISTDEKDLISTQREKRLAPQPPGRNQAEKPSQKVQDASTRHLAQINKKGKDKDVKTVGVFPQRSVQMIAPLNGSPTDSKNTQSSTETNATKGATDTAKHTKRPAPSRPRSVEEEQSSEPKTASYSDSKTSPRDASETKQVQIVYGLNPFEDDENEVPAQDDAAVSGNTGSIRWPPAASQTADNDDASQMKIKSSKIARAPLPPAKNDSASSSSINQNTEGEHVTDGTGVAVPENPVKQTCNPQPEARCPVTVQESPLQESQPVKVQNVMEAGVKKEGPPTTSRRLQPVRPLNPLEQQPVSLVQEENSNTSTGNLSGVQNKTKVNDTGMKAPYSQLTQEELITLVQKQENQLSEKDKKISELEQYIDNLLVRVIEEQPSILMSLSSLKKAT